MVSTQSQPRSQRLRRLSISESCWHRQISTHYMYTCRCLWNASPVERSGMHVASRPKTLKRLSGIGWLRPDRASCLVSTRPGRPAPPASRAHTQALWCARSNWFGSGPILSSLLISQIRRRPGTPHHHLQAHRIWGRSTTVTLQHEWEIISYGKWFHDRASHKPRQGLQFEPDIRRLGT